MKTSFNWLFMHDIVSMCSRVCWKSPTPGNRRPSSREQTAEVPTSRRRGRWAQSGTELNLMPDVLMCRLLCIYNHTHTHMYTHIYIYIFYLCVYIKKCMYIKINVHLIPLPASLTCGRQTQCSWNFARARRVRLPSRHRCRESILLYVKRVEHWQIHQSFFMAACMSQALNWRRQVSFIT